VPSDPSPIRRIIDELGPGAELSEVMARTRQEMNQDVIGAMQRYLKVMSVRMQAGLASYRRYGVVFEAYFYFVRIYQDANYTALNSLLGDRTAAGSMKYSLKPANPVGRRLEQDAPGYLEWFRSGGTRGTAQRGSGLSHSRTTL